MKKVMFFWLLVLIVVVLQAPSEGSVSYTMNITSGYADTSGGYDGMGVGTLLIDGSFKLNINYASGYANLEDIDITFSEPAYPLAFYWSTLEGTYNFGNISLSSYCLPGLTNSLSGTFDGRTAFLQGTVRDSFYDGYQYDCTIEAVVVPEPVMAGLLALGCLLIRQRRK